MNLRVERLPREDVPVVAVHGELDIEGAPALRAALIEAIDERAGQHVVVDLEGVEFIDSAGLGVLLGGLERARGAEGGLALVATGQSVIRVLELTGLTRVFEIYPSRTAALGADRRPQATDS